MSRATLQKIEKTMEEVVIILPCCNYLTCLALKQNNKINMNGKGRV